MKASEFVTNRTRELAEQHSFLDPSQALLELLDRVIPDVDRVEGIVKMALDADLLGAARAAAEPAAELFRREEVANVVRALLAERSGAEKLDAYAFGQAAGILSSFSREQALRIAIQLVPASTTAKRANELLDRLSAAEAVAGAPSPPAPAGANGPSAPTEMRRSSYAELIHIMGRMTLGFDPAKLVAAIAERMPKSMPASRQKFSYDDIVWIIEKLTGGLITDWKKFHEALAFARLAEQSADAVTVSELCRIAYTYPRTLDDVGFEIEALLHALKAARGKEELESVLGAFLLCAFDWTLALGISPIAAIDLALRKRQ